MYHGAASSRAARGSAAFVTFITIIHEPCGSELTASGFSASRVFTSVTSPLTGQYSSETALTDSIVPKTSPFLKRAAHLRQFEVDDVAELPWPRSR